MTASSDVSTSSNASIVRLRRVTAGGSTSFASTNIPGSMVWSFTSTATAATARCADGAKGSRLVTTTRGGSPGENRREPRRNSGQSIVNVSNSPPSPQQWDPYADSIS